MPASQLEFGGALVLGIAPALSILYLSLRRFDRPRTEHTLFDDRRVFGGLAVGLVYGVLASVLDTSVLGLAFDFVSSVVVLFALFLVDELFKLVYLNRKGYSGRFDTTFYGVAIGVGAAATSVVGSVVWVSLPQLEADQGVVLLRDILLLVLFSVSLSLVNADTGALIGFGASRGEMRSSFLRAVAVRYAHAALLLAFFLGAPPEWGFVAALSSVAFAGIVYHYVYTQILPGTLPEDIRREMRRERRARTVKD
jgi:hypothetical protein